VSETETSSDPDVTLLRRALTLAHTARATGARPFGAILAGRDGEVIVEAANDVLATRDVTGHAETRAVQRATVLLTDDQLRETTLYASAEPCLMCSGAIYLAGIPRVVFGLPVGELGRVQGPDSPVRGTQGISTCLRGLADAPTTIHLDLGEELRAPHLGYWQEDPS
jgi:tRNA(Arg) A34 adenosine deaminase TadA